LRARIVAANATRPSFANSEGCSVSGPTSIHLDAPYSEVPDAGCAAISISTEVTASRGRLSAIQILGDVLATRNAVTTPASA
jgi:hypothetical protein